MADAAKLGTIKYLANVAGIQHINAVEDFPMEKYDLMQRSCFGRLFTCQNLRSLT